MLNACGVNTVAAGNIGPAFSARVRQSDSLDVMTLEVSSFQLEAIRKFRANIAVWLNFAPDHLDRYRSMDEYYAAKLRIFENQTEEDWAIVNLRDTLPPLRAQKITFSAYASGGDFELRDGVIHFHGEPVLAIGGDAPSRRAQCRKPHGGARRRASCAASSFEQMRGAALRVPAARRTGAKRIRVLDGVEWVNDSKGTNLDSVEKALLSETRRVVLIAGGKDKGFEYDSLTELVAEKCRAAIVIGEMADRIEQLWSIAVPCRNAGRSLERAVALAQAEAQPGDVVLFSPALRASTCSRTTPTAGINSALWSRGSIQRRARSMDLAIAATRRTVRALGSAGFQPALAGILPAGAGRAARARRILFQNTARARRSRMLRRAGWKPALPEAHASPVHAATPGAAHLIPFPLPT